MPIATFVELVSDGWNTQHTFQQPEFNRGQVIVCRGKFAVEERV